MATLVFSHIDQPYFKRHSPNCPPMEICDATELSLSSPPIDPQTLLNEPFPSSITNPIPSSIPSLVINEVVVPSIVLDQHPFQSDPLRDLFPKVASALEEMQVSSLPIRNDLTMSDPQKDVTELKETDEVNAEVDQTEPKKKRSRKPPSKVRSGSKANRRAEPKKTQKQPKKNPSRKRRLVDDEAEPDDSDLNDESSSDDDESIGSLAEFIVDDEEEIKAEEKESRKKQKNEDPLDGIDPSNIITGKRQRKKPERYVDPNYWKIMTQDMDESEVEEFENDIEKEDVEEEEKGDVDGGDNPSEDEDFKVTEEEEEEETESSEELKDEEEEEEEEDDEEEEEEDEDDSDYED